MAKFWEDVKSYVKQGATVVAEKTEELSKMGKIKIDIMGIERNLQKALSELGGQVYHLVTADENIKIVDDEKVKEIIARIKGFEEQLEVKKQELEEVGKEKQETEEESSESVTVVEDSSSRAGDEK